MQVLDECAGRQVCAVKVGAFEAGAACVRDNQCELARAWTTTRASELARATTVWWRSELC